MRLISLLLLTCVMSKLHSRRKNRHRKGRRKHKPRTTVPTLGSKNRDLRVQPFTTFETNYYSAKHKMITDLINSDMPLINDEPFSSNAYEPCISPAPTCAEGETCRRVYEISCEIGSCDQIPRQYCESTCIYDCPNDQDMQSNIEANIIPTPLSLSTTTVTTITTKSIITDSTKISRPTGNLYSEPTMIDEITVPPPTTVPPTTVIQTPPKAVSTRTTSSSTKTTPITTTKSINTPTSTKSVSTSKTTPTVVSFALKPDQSVTSTKPQITVETRNCIFLNIRGGYQCQNWNSPTISRDLKEARMRKSNDLRQYIDQYSPNFDIPTDPDFKKILEKSFPAYIDEFLTLKIFTKCVNYHFYLFRYKEKMSGRPMPRRKISAESIITMMKMRDICGIPLTPIRKEIMLNSLWFFARNLRRNKTIGLAQYIIKACEDEVTVDPRIEEHFVNRALQRVLTKSARTWSENPELLNGIKTSTQIPDDQLAKMSPIIKEAVSSAMKTKSNDLREIIFNIMKASRTMMTKR